MGRRFLGIDKEEDFLKISIARKHEIENNSTAALFKQKLNGFKSKNQLEMYLMNEPSVEYGNELEF